MTLKTTNVTFGSFLSMDEVLQYRPHPTDPSKTLLRQQATVSIEGVPLNRYMEEVLTNNINNNANRGRQGLEWVINKINTEVRILMKFELRALCFVYDSFLVINKIPFLSSLVVSGEGDCTFCRRLDHAN